MRVPAGDSRALVGRNGAGKSTLVGVLTGLLAPDTGAVRFGGEAGARRSPSAQQWRDRRRLRLPEIDLIPTLTVAENLFLNAHPTGGPAGSAGARLRREAERVLAELGPGDSTSSQECRAAHGRAAADRRDRAGAASRARASSSSTSRRRNSRRARCARLFERIVSPAGGRRHVPLHLAPPRGDLRGLPQRDGAARRARSWPRRRWPTCRRSGWSPPWWATSARAGGPSRGRPRADAAPRQAPALEVRELRDRRAPSIGVSFAGRRRRMRRASPGSRAPARARSATRSPACSRPAAARSGRRRGAARRRCGPTRGARASATCRATATRAASSRCSRSPRT